MKERLKLIYKNARHISSVPWACLGDEVSRKFSCTLALFIVLLPLAMFQEMWSGTVFLEVPPPDFLCCYA